MLFLGKTYNSFYNLALYPIAEFVSLERHSTYFYTWFRYENKQKNQPHHENCHKR